MKRLELSRVADADLDDLLKYGAAEYGEDAAGTYYLSFEDSFELLQEYPEIAPLAEGLRGNVRCWHHRSHRIFYRYDGEVVLIGRILHYSVDVEGQFGL